MGDAPTEKPLANIATQPPPPGQERRQASDKLDDNDLYTNRDELLQQLKRTFPTEDDSVMTVRLWVASLMSRRGLRPPRKFMLPWTGRELNSPMLNFDYAVKVFKIYGVDKPRTRIIRGDDDKPLNEASAGPQRPRIPTPLPCYISITTMAQRVFSKVNYIAGTSFNNSALPKSKIETYILELFKSNAKGNQRGNPEYIHMAYVLRDMKEMEAFVENMDDRNIVYKTNSIRDWFQNHNPKNPETWTARQIVILLSTCAKAFPNRNAKDIIPFGQDCLGEEKLKEFRESFKNLDKEDGI
ncbi:hypothetical protein LY76DRAFT_610589 [Colletotrichum caudatum]|nr:hypothetical protein LY76DRAFT_610589 [Colletotrichum caudatum]